MDDGCIAPDRGDHHQEDVQQRHEALQPRGRQLIVCYVMDAVLSSQQNATAEHVHGIPV